MSVVDEIGYIRDHMINVETDLVDLETTFKKELQEAHEEGRQEGYNEGYEKGRRDYAGDFTGGQ